MAKEEEQFIVETIEKLEAQFEWLNKPIPWHISHGRRRSQRKMQEIRDQREKQMSEVERALQALKSDGHLEITFIRDQDGHVSGFKI